MMTQEERLRQTLAERGETDFNIAFAPMGLATGASELSAMRAARSGGYADEVADALPDADMSWNALLEEFDGVPGIDMPVRAPKISAADPDRARRALQGRTGLSTVQDVALEGFDDAAPALPSASGTARGAEAARGVTGLSTVEKSALSSFGNAADDSGRAGRAVSSVLGPSPGTKAALSSGVMFPAAAGLDEAYNRDARGPGGQMRDDPLKTAFDYYAKDRDAVREAEDIADLTEDGKSIDLTVVKTAFPAIYPLAYAAARAAGRDVITNDQAVRMVQGLIGTGLAVPAAPMAALGGIAAGLGAAGVASASRSGPLEDALYAAKQLERPIEEGDGQWVGKLRSAGLLEKAHEAGIVSDAALRGAGPAPAAPARVPADPDAGPIRSWRGAGGYAFRGNRDGSFTIIDTPVGEERRKGVVVRQGSDAHTAIANEAAKLGVKNA